MVEQWGVLLVLVGIILLSLPITQGVSILVVAYFIAAILFCFKILFRD